MAIGNKGMAQGSVMFVFCYTVISYNKGWCEFRFTVIQYRRKSMTANPRTGEPTEHVTGNSWMDVIAVIFINTCFTFKFTN